MTAFERDVHDILIISFPWHCPWTVCHIQHCLGRAEQRGGGGLDLSPGEQVGKKSLGASGQRLRRLAQRALQLAANAGAACVGGALGLLGGRQKPVNGPEAADCRGLAVLGGCSAEREVSSVHRVAESLASVALPVRGYVVAKVASPSSTARRSSGSSAILPVA